MQRNDLWQRIEPAAASCFDRAAIRTALLILMGAAMVMVCVAAPARAETLPIPYAHMDEGDPLPPVGADEAKG